MGKVLDEKCLNCGASITYDSKEDVITFVPFVLEDTEEQSNENKPVE